MSETDTHIRVSRAVKARLKRRKAADESLSDVIDRYLDRDADFYAGFGRGRRADALREAVDRDRQRSKERIRTLTEQRDDDAGEAANDG